MRWITPLWIVCMLVCSAGIGAAEPASLPPLESKTSGNRLEVLPPTGHHFNDKAPASAAEGTTPLTFKLEKKRLEVSLPENATEQEVTTDVFVCDDANTFCKKTHQAFKVGPVTAQVAGAEKSSSKASTAAKAEPPHFEKGTGFYVNDPKKAFAAAAAKKLPLMIDFFGIWCPPCNHLDAVVFHSAEFKKKTGQRFIKLKLDSDHDQFNELKNLYKIQALPTVVFATPGGDEIFRLVGYHPPEEMLEKAEAAFASHDEGYAQLAAKATGGNAEARYKAARIALDRDEPAKALEWLTPLKALLEANHDPRLMDFYRAQLGTADAAGPESKDKKLVKKTLEDWVKTFPDSPYTLETYETLIDVQEEDGQKAEAKASVTRALALADKLIAAGEAGVKGTYFTPADVAEYKAELLAKQGDEAKTKAAYLACAEAYEKEATAEKSAFPRGPNLEIAYCLGKAGEIAKSEAIYREGIKRFPGEYTFYQGMAKMWLDAAKDASKALPQAKKAVHYSYGNQRLKAMMTLARAYESLKQPKAAIEAIENELKNPPAEGASPGTLKLREKLRAKAEELRKKTETTASS